MPPCSRRPGQRRKPVHDDVADERRALGARLSPDDPRGLRARAARRAAPGGRPPRRERVLRLPRAPALDPRAEDPSAPRRRPVPPLPPPGVRPRVARRAGPARDEASRVAGQADRGLERDGGRVGGRPLDGAEPGSLAAPRRRRPPRPAIADRARVAPPPARASGLAAFGGSAAASAGDRRRRPLRPRRAGPPPRGRLFVHRASGWALGYTIDGLAAWFAGSSWLSSPFR